MKTSQIKYQPTVFVVDDEADIRTALVMLIKSIGLAVETYASPQAFLQNYRAEQPGCLVLDVRMPGMSGPELQERLNAFNDAPPIIMISGHGEIPMAVKALKDGALDFLQKPFSDQVLLDRIQQAIVLDAAQRRDNAERRELERRYHTLTQREREVLQGVVDGRINKVIASELNVSTRTVEIHRAHVMEKMQAASLSSLVHMMTVLKSPSAR